MAEKTKENNITETEDQNDLQEESAQTDSSEGNNTPETPEKGKTDDPLDLLQEKIEEAEKSADAFKDQFLRKAAEFDNYKKRTDSERLELIKSANERLIGLLLPVLDDFQRTLKAGSAKHDFDVFFKGVELVSNKLLKILENQGLSSFDSLGKPFDVDFHDALLQTPSTDVPPNTVIEEVEKGYNLNDKVLRHAKVIVSSAPQKSDEGNPSSIDAADEKSEGE